MTQFLMDCLKHKLTDKLQDLVLFKESLNVLGQQRTMLVKFRNIIVDKFTDQSSHKIHGRMAVENPLGKFQFEVDANSWVVNRQDFDLDGLLIGIIEGFGTIGSDESRVGWSKDIVVAFDDLFDLKNCEGIGL